MSWQTSNLHFTLLKFKANSLLRSMDFTRTIFVTYLLGLGISNTQIGILQTLLFVSSFLVEIPSGIASDKYSRKWMMFLSGIIYFLAFLFFLLAGSNFYLLLLTFSLIGISFAINSGADAALMYDGLLETKNENLHVKLLGHLRSLGTIGLLISGACAGFLFDYNPSLPFLFTLFAIFLSLLVVLSIPESYRVKSPHVKKAYFDFLRHPKGKKLIKFIICLSLLEAVHTPLFIFSQSLFSHFSFTPSYISIIITASYVVMLFTFRFAPLLEKFRTKNILIFTIITMLICLFLIFYFKNPYLAIIAFILYNTAPNLLFIKTDDYIIKNAAPEIRASIISTQSFVNSICIAVGYIVFGWLFDHLGQIDSLKFIFSWLMFLLVIFYFGVFKNEDSSSA